MANTIRSWLTV